MKDEKIRRQTVAGSFYDASPTQLHKVIEDLIFTASIKKNGLPVQALIVPHAGYIFSGATAAATFKTALNCDYKRIAVIAPSHYHSLTGIAYSSFESYETPFGNLKVDSETIKKLMQKDMPWIQSGNSPHKEEHSLEVQLPFIRHIFGEIEILPFVCGRVDDKIALSIAEVLLPFFNMETLWVISSDFTHYGTSFRYTPFKDDIRNKIKALDMGAVDKIIELDFEGFSDFIEKTRATICGCNPIKILLMMCHLANKGNAIIIPELVDYTNSGELTGDYSHCVSYAGITFYRKV